MSPATFVPPVVQENETGWGPCRIPEQYSDLPYQPFSKGDRIGKVADWTGQTYSDKRLANKYNTQFGGGGQYAYYQDDEEGSYQLVDTSRGGTRVTRSRFRIGQRNVRNRQTGGRNQMQVLNKGGRNARSQPQSQQRGKWQKNASRNRYDAKGQVKKRDTSASVPIKSSWRVIEEMDFLRLSKLSLPGVGDGKDVMKCGSLEYYDKQYDRVTCRNEKRLQRMNRVSYTVTTTDDPIIRQLSKTMGQVYATDAIISTLMCATRSVSSWDIVVQRVDNKLFFDKREDSNFDLLTVNETAAEPPFVDDDGKNSINSPQNLALEATYINFNFSQQVLKVDEKGQRYSFEHPNPFAKEEDSGEPASVAYRYRKFDLLNYELIVRTEVGAATIGPSNEIQFMNIKGLNEWDPKSAGGINWREKLDVQRGAVLANELKNNSCKLSKWTVQSLLAATDQLKFGYISRVTSRDSSKHAILGTQQFKPREFADQINLNMDNAWGILHFIVDTCMKLEQGKYLLLKDPNKPTLLLYDIPDNTFDGDDDDEEDDDDDDRQGPEAETGTV